MKNYILGLALTGMIYSAYACTNPSANNTNAENTKTSAEQAQNNPKFADAKVNEVYQHYIHLKTALVNEDNKEATVGAEMLSKAIKDAGIESKIIKGMVSAKDLTAKRAQFSNLSNELADTFRKSKLESGVVYKQYCPMANDNNGGYWLASENKIQNPYYGSKMMSCGSVEEEIK
ncbi:DUF3347 domain-containing protein [Pedobacter arcticus]|uniref:DUF3347 domain-containing protein n=1 Tax=Pedobacter arcticus TaxID=752140 RepID=UPI0002FE922D|nr:DUF3347 domain-containing protein [Pedobacter arcticus]